MRKENKKETILNGHPEGMTQEEVAKKLGITRSLAGAIERKALEKIRSKLERRNIKKEDLF